MEDNLVTKLNYIQTHLNAPKDARNTFGGYNYRSAESILKAVKPLLDKQKVCITLSDQVIMIGDRIYIQATAKITDGKAELHTTAFAREPDIKKGADPSQITGTASSYARKYALCGLFAIDDNKDADALNRHDTSDSNKQEKQESVLQSYMDEMKSSKNLQELKTHFGKAWHEVSDKEERDQLSRIYSHLKADFLAA